MASKVDPATVARVAGRTFCEQAGFTLRDKPAALYQLLVLTTLLAKPIAADLAVAGCAELRRAGMRTPRGMLRATWQTRVDALGRAHYRRFDESSATILGESAQMLLDTYGGDLRRLRDRAGDNTVAMESSLTEVPGIGPSGAAIFLREAQRVWPSLRPYLDDRVLSGARTVGVPHSRRGLTRWLDGVDDPTAVVTGLVRADLDAGVAARMRP